jgi:carbon monoxide dehydrogenase subunit G
LLIERRYLVDAPADQVWDALLDLESLATCIPGCESCTKIDDTTYSATVKTKVAYISAEFKGKLTVDRIEAPTLLEVTMRGQDSKLASLISARTRAEVKALSPSQTEVACVADASVGGKLGALGGSVIRSKAEEMLDQTFVNAKERLLGLKS